MKILILGGTSESSELVKLLADRSDMKVTMSLAGRTINPILPKNQNVKTIIGGFGGSAGLAEYIRKNKITTLICATHPFARNMPFNALEAAKIEGIPLLFVLRPEWKEQKGDQWIKVSDHAQAIAALGNDVRSVFLTVGRLELLAYSIAPEHLYVIRSIDDISEKPLPKATYITARPPFSIANEIELMREFEIEFLITKNSGGFATEAKLTAARERNIPTILISRPTRPIGKHVATATEAVEWIEKTSSQ